MVFLATYIYFLSSTCAHCLVIPKYTSCELIMIFGLTEIIILIYACFPLQMDKARSVEPLGECAGSLG
jgi:hypothetical protein